MSVIFEGIDMQNACTSVTEEQNSGGLHTVVTKCAFYNICKQRETVKTNCKPKNCPLKSLTQDSEKGYWIQIKDKFGQHKIKCSKCDYIEPKYITFLRDFCPSCGSAMSEEE